MTILRAGDREFHNLPAGQVLTVVASAASAGLVRRYPADSGFAAIEVTPVAAGATVNVGPFTGTVRLGVECTTGLVDWSAGPSAPALAPSASGDAPLSGDASALTAIAEGATTARPLAARAADSVNVRDFGAVGNGATDDTAAFAAAIAAGRPVDVPDGTYIIDSLAVPSTAALVMSRGATLRHKSGSTGHMIVFTGTFLSIEGGTVDGNRKNQGAATVRRYAIYTEVPHTARVSIDGVKFVSTRAAAIYTYNFGGEVDITNCRFSDMMEHNGAAGEFWTAAAYTASGEPGYQGRYRFNYNVVEGSASPALDGAAPGGLFFAPTTDAGFSAGNNSTIEVIGNDFRHCGQNIASNDLACVHLYPASDSARVIGNRFMEPWYDAIAAKSVMNFVCAFNTVVNGHVSSRYTPVNQGAIGYEPGYHSGSNSRPRAVIVGNIVDNPGRSGGSPPVSQTGIMVVGTDTSIAVDFVVSDNVVSGSGVAIWLQRVQDGVVSGNRVTGGTGDASGSQPGIRFDYVTGTLKIDRNFITVSNGIGIYGQFGINTANILVEGNYVKATAQAAYAMQVLGAALLRASGNMFDSENGTVNVASDGTNNTGELMWDATNRTIGAATAFNYAQINKLTGHGTHRGFAPEAIGVKAATGALWSPDTDSHPGLFLKRGASSGSSCWGAVVAERFSVITYSATMAVDLAAGTGFGIAPTNASAFTISNPSGPSPYVGQTLTITISNNTGGSLGTATWGALYKLASWTQPATGFSRSISFQWSGSAWVEISRTPGDVPI